MAIATSVAAPPLLRATLGSWQGTEAEQRRLAAEDSERTRLITGHRAPLLRDNADPPTVVAAQIVDLCWPSGVAVTLVRSDGCASPEHVDAVHNVLAERRTDVVRTEPLLAGARLIREAARGYSAVVVGLPGNSGAELPHDVAALLSSSTIPTVLVRPERVPDQKLPGAFGRALVPVTGTVASQAAQELAAGVAGRLGTELVLAHIDTSPRTLAPFGSDPLVHPLTPGDVLLRSAHEQAMRSGTPRARTVSIAGSSPAERLVELCGAEDVDVIIVGATPRSSDGFVYLGPVVSHLLEHSPVTVVVAVVPPGWVAARAS
ncbi:MAG: universal stress protein [Acidimicrobiales bacterium]